MSFLQMLSDYAGTWADLFTIAYLQPSFVTYLQEARVLSNILQISYRKQWGIFSLFLPSWEEQAAI